MKQQKLVTVRLEVVRGGRSEDLVQEHLAEYLENGWTIASVTPAGPGGSFTVCWFAVVLERN